MRVLLKLDCISQYEVAMRLWRLSVGRNSWFGCKMAPLTCVLKWLLPKLWHYFGGLQKLRAMLGILLIFLPHYFEIMSFTELRARLVARKIPVSISTTHHAGAIGMLATPKLFMSSGVPDSGPHACTAGIFTHRTICSAQNYSLRLVSIQPTAVIEQVAVSLSLL